MKTQIIRVQSSFHPARGWSVGAQGHIIRRCNLQQYVELQEPRVC